PEDVTFADVTEVCEPVKRLDEAGEIDSITLVYNEFRSSLEQRAVSVRLLPFGVSAEEAAAVEAAAGDGAEEGQAAVKSMEVEYEPSAKAVFAYLVPKYLEIVIYKAVKESAYCEHTARRTAMQNATDNAREKMDDLNLFYNRARQAAITSEITEIVSGADALNG
ncbi:MAG: F0F1 ATP synthase subunit gamma, partial [Clostridiales Family XIII bacterium]|nr:F0F1 ATP synthase subunit gamma [Clostridiales Family XIII bacterium]